MSRQSKAAKRKTIAKGFTALHLAREKGPAQTKPLHGKVRTEWKERANKVIAQNLAKEQAEAEKQKAAKAKKEERAAAEAKSKGDAPKAKKPASKAKPVTA